MLDSEKACTVCDEAKPLAEFRREAKSPGGYAARCKVCLRAAEKAARQTPPESSERFWQHVDKRGPMLSLYLGPCWLWTGPDNGWGYGSYCGQWRAHKLVYEWQHGPVPEGLELHHVCHNRRCVNPAHLEAVTHRENMLHGAGVSWLSARKTHCKRGHLFDEANTYRYRGWRVCRACRRKPMPI